MTFYDNLREIIYNNFGYEILCNETMQKIVYLLNNNFFYDNTAEFIDKTTQENMSNGEISLVI